MKTFEIAGVVYGPDEVAMVRQALIQAKGQALRGESFDALLACALHQAVETMTEMAAHIWGEAWDAAIRMEEAPEPDGGV